MPGKAEEKHEKLPSKLLDSGTVDRIRIFRILGVGNNYGFTYGGMKAIQRHQY